MSPSLRFLQFPSAYPLGIPTIHCQPCESLAQVKPSRDLNNFWAHKSFCVPHFLFLWNELQPPLPSLSSKGQVQTIANQGREGMQRPGRSSQETIVQLWGRVLVPPQGIFITISLNSSAELNPPQMEDVNEAFFIQDRRPPNHGTPALKIMQARLYPHLYLWPYFSPSKL